MSEQQFLETMIVLSQVREAFERRGTRSTKDLGRTFRTFVQVRHRNKLSSEDFFVGLLQHGVEVNRKQSDVTYYIKFDRDHDSYLSLDEFLLIMRKKPNKKRQSLIDEVFRRLGHNGVITTGDLRQIYDCKNNSKVKNGTMSEEQVLREFLFNLGARNKDGSITYQEWDSYYAGISQNFENDDHFIEMMKKAWKLS